MLKDLREAKFERYVLGSENVHRAEKKLVKCIERLGQSLNGLRSAAETQFELLRRQHEDIGESRSRLFESALASPTPSKRDIDPMAHLQPITEEPEESDLHNVDETSGNGLSIIRAEHQTSTGLSDIFCLFIKELGPSMKSSSPYRAAAPKKAIVISKEAFNRGLGLEEIPCLENGLKPPSQV